MLENTEEILNPADQLRADIESVVADQERGGEPEAVEAEAPAETEGRAEEGETGTKRDEKGRFVSKAPEGAEEEPTKAAEAPKDDKVETAPADEGKPAIRPPPGFSIASKQAWDALPESVRADIAKREEEMTAGLQRYGGLKQFAEEAERNGTTLQKAVSDYVAVETALGQNFVGGIEFICQRLGVHPGQLAQAMARRWLAQQAPQGEAPQQVQQAPPQPAFDANAIARQVAQQVAGQLRTEAQQRELGAQIEAFASDPKNKFFPNVRQHMARIVQVGDAEGKELNIQQAYEAACWQNPEIRSILLSEANDGRNKEAATAVSKARSAAKAVGGAPAPGVTPDTSGRRKDLSLDDEIRAAVDAQIGA